MVLVLVNFHPVSRAQIPPVFCRIPNFHIQSRLLPSALDSLLLYSYTSLYSDISDLTYPTLNFDNHLSSKNKQTKKKKIEREEEKPMLLSDLQNLSKWQFQLPAIQVKPLQWSLSLLFLSCHIQSMWRC